MTDEQFSSLLASNQDILHALYYCQAIGLTLAGLVLTRIAVAAWKR